MFKKGFKPNTKRGKMKPEIWILLYLRFTPKEIINLGYSKSIVYKYSALMPEIQERLKNKLKPTIQQQPKANQIKEC